MIPATFDVPFLPDQPYLELLKRFSTRLQSVHFSLGNPTIADARFPLHQYSLDDLLQGLEFLDAIPGLALLNSRFHGQELLAGSHTLQHIVRILERLHERGRLQGVVFADFYLLTALAKAAPSLCSQIEAVPSINFMLDTGAKAVSLYRRIETTGFCPPTRMVLDRCLNRDLAGLQATSTGIRKQLPHMRLLLLANEGCLLHCPFKPAHDSLMALSRMQGGPACDASLNRDLGCTRLFHDQPEEIFRSPLIRPEDLGLYDGFVDGFKLCGRTRGARTLTSLLHAYMNGQYVGNLLELADTMECLSHVMFVDNTRIPQTFAATAAGCGLDCDACGLCRGLAEDLVRREQPGIAPVDT